MKTEKSQRLHGSKKLNDSSRDYTPAQMLLAIQCAGLPLLGAMLVLMWVVNTGTRQVFYLILTASLVALTLVSMLLNVKGYCRISAWVTVSYSIAAPWVCVFYDPAVLSGNIIPLVFAALAIQLCSILFSLRVTIVVIVLQLSALSVLVALCPGLRNVDWAGLTIFIAFSATLGILTSLLNRRHMEQIEKDREALRESEARLKTLVERDSLTGLYNRRYMEEALHREIGRALKKGQPLCVIMADLDDFKLINDTYGHALGDKVLVRVAKILSQNTRRKTDVICRYGGDEFIIILPDCTPEDAMLRAQDLRELVGEAPFSFGSYDIGRITMSIGVSSMPQNGITAAELLAAADKALYGAKYRGRNCVMASCL